MIWVVLMLSNLTIVTDPLIQKRVSYTREENVWRICSYLSLFSVIFQQKCIIHDALHAAQKPLVNLCQLVQLIYAVPFLVCSSKHMNTLIRRLLQFLYHTNHNYFDRRVLLMSKTWVEQTICNPYTPRHIVSTNYLVHSQGHRWWRLYKEKGTYLIRCSMAMRIKTQVWLVHHP